jgi:ribosome-binding factor A
MEEGKRQKQVAGLLLDEVNQVFQKLGISMIDGGMVSISTVKITPDLFEARIYLSFFQVKDPEAALKKISERGWEIKKELSHRVGKQLRRMPEIKYFKDDTLDHVFKMEEIFRGLGGTEKPGDDAGNDTSPKN